MNQFKFLVVGQGLAGTLFSYQLLKCNQSFIVIDNNYNLSSSKVAAGMFSPVGGKRMLKTWLAETLLENLDNTYLELESLLNTKFYFKQKILQIFQQNELEIYNHISDLPKDDPRKQYIEINNEIKNFKHIDNSFGSAFINKGGWINTEELINSFSDYLKSKNQVINIEINYDDLYFKDNKWHYKNYIFDKVIFCEGFKSIHNPYFKHLPFQLCKGEVLHVDIKNIEKDFILKKGIYLVNLKNDIYKVGASYEWKDLTLSPTQKGIDFIINKLKNFINSDYKIITTKAGIRPTVLDKKPLIGEHHDFKGLYIFNGLGTKGVMLAPYFSEMLINNILYNKEILSDVDIKRFEI